MEYKITFKKYDNTYKKLLRLQKLFNDKKVQTTIRRIIDDFKIE